jgi:hypothetical protein
MRVHGGIIVAMLAELSVRSPPAFDAESCLHAYRVKSKHMSIAGRVVYLPGGNISCAVLAVRRRALNTSSDL